MSAAPPRVPVRCSVLICDKASTRAELVASTGLARSTVSQRMDALLSQGLVVPLGENASTGGRPPQTFAFNANAGVILVAGLGATHSTIAITNLAAEVLAEEPVEVAIADGPESVMARVDEVFVRLLAEIDRTEADVRGVGVGVPGPVEFATGTPVAPPIMPGWHGFQLGDSLRDRWACQPSSTTTSTSWRSVSSGRASATTPTCCS